MLITYWYDIEKLLLNIGVISDYKTNTLVEKQGGEPRMLPSVAVQDNSIAVKLLNDASAEIFLLMSGYAKDVVDENDDALEPYSFDVAYDDITRAIVYNFNFPDTFNDKIIGGIERAIKSAIENYVLSRYNQIAGLDFQLYERNFEREKDRILLYINRRTETVKRAYKLF